MVQWLGEGQEPMSTLYSSATTHKTHTLRDGRSLGYAEYGDPEGKPMFHFHGYLGSRLEASVSDEAAAKVGVRLIGIDRPGMGLSDFQPGRQILDWPDDVVQLANTLEIDSFAVEGVSVGGPYALACAYQVPDRLTACGIVAGLGPIDLLGTEGMMLGNRVRFFVARRLSWFLRAIWWLDVGRYRRHTQDEKKIKELSLKFWKGLPEAGRNALGTLYIAQMLEALLQGSRGPAHDAKLYVQPWGFKLEDVAFNNVYLWHGERDVNVPVSMGRAMAKAIPHCQARFYPGETHLLVAYNHLEEIMEAMIS